MKQSTQEWVERAEEAWGVAVREARARKIPRYNLACNLAQQCAEKYLKARLEEAGISFKKTHDLEELLNPGVNATSAMARDAVKSCGNLRKAVRASLGLPI